MAKPVKVRRGGVTKSGQGKSRKSAKAGQRRAAGANAGKNKKRLDLPMGIALEFYRPLKKPVTLRLDADVIAWFKRGGKRYQTRINSALRKVMEREIRAAGG
jgi:uncharacterized protein (DUF4415 family)